MINGLFLKTEAVQSKAGRYINPEENPFFPENLPPSAAPDYPFSEFLQGAGASINTNKEIWKMYFDDLIPMFIRWGDDGNYAQTALADLKLLQAISKRIHYGKFVAEVKFRESPKIYEPLIRAKDREALMNELRSESVEERVVKRVERKATVFGQQVSLEYDVSGDTYMINSVAPKRVTAPVRKRAPARAAGSIAGTTLVRGPKGGDWARRLWQKRRSDRVALGGLGGSRRPTSVEVVAVAGCKASSSRARRGRGNELATTWTATRSGRSGGGGSVRGDYAVAGLC
ncbi:hypothetical protein LR48_Vigan04g226000 [Vigna angularis]|uniref:chorismate mutase n=1 Tax=Phaseolus angularis TaxID=3914 RepID=A0A0L9UHN0_PHAAN|nr:hypothetical protein LR48_Vigan04g226000 [Vigna angularis]